MQFITLQALVNHYRHFLAIFRHGRMYSAETAHPSSCLTKAMKDHKYISTVHSSEMIWSLSLALWKHWLPGLNARSDNPHYSQNPFGYLLSSGSGTSANHSSLFQVPSSLPPCPPPAHPLEQQGKMPRRQTEKVSQSQLVPVVPLLTSMRSKAKSEADYFFEIAFSITALTCCIRKQGSIL